MVRHSRGEEEASMIGKALISAGVTVLVLSGAAWAGDCSVVNNSFLAVQALPGFDEKITLTPAGKPATDMEMITLGDAVYMKFGDKAWRKQAITAAARKETTATMMKTMAPTDCTVAGSETVAGVPTTIYAFQQPDVRSKGQMLDVKMWIANSDGLPRKSLSNISATTFSYDNITAPIP
jgi:hypothetical protein